MFGDSLEILVMQLSPRIASQRHLSSTAAVLVLVAVVAGSAAALVSLLPLA